MISALLLIILGIGAVAAPSRMASGRFAEAMVKERGSPLKSGRR
jgi:hypothetical protein